jgi:glutaredoxin
MGVARCCPCNRVFVMTLRAAPFPCPFCHAALELATLEDALHRALNPHAVAVPLDDFHLREEALALKTADLARRAREAIAESLRRRNPR